MLAPPPVCTAGCGTEAEQNWPRPRTSFQDLTLTLRWEQVRPTAVIPGTKVSAAQLFRTISSTPVGV
eukprot:2234529-Rhodomonas_salina.1